MNMANTKSLLIAALLALGVLTAGIVLAACGNDEDDAGGAGAATATAAGNGVDLAFVQAMIPHHESAIEMAEIARDRGQSEFVRDLAADIIRTQSTEISTLRTIDADLQAAGVEPEPGALGEHADAMEMDASSLRTADPFDREFIDMMVAHHQSAIQMARIALDQGESDEAQQLAEQIIAAQAREIRAMNEHRTEEFGAPSPAGGVPAEDDTQPDADAGEHPGETTTGDAAGH